MQLKYLITAESITLKSNTFISIPFAWKRTVYTFTCSRQFLRENVPSWNTCVRRRRTHTDRVVFGEITLEGFTD